MTVRSRYSDILALFHMKPIPKLNRASRSWPVRWVSVTLFVAACVGLLQRQLADIYARPSALPAVSAKPSPGREDALLFDRSLAAGLLRLGEDGRIAIAPADLPLRQAYARDNPELLAPRSDEPDWLNGVWNENVRQIHRALHFSAAGRYVRQQVEAFNSQAWLAAVRWQSFSEEKGEWRADWAEAPLVLTETVPPSIDRLSAGIDGDWQPWRRVARWPALEGRFPVRFQLRWARPSHEGERAVLFVVGGIPTVTGARVVTSERCCLRATVCAESEAVARRLWLELPEGATGLEASFSPLPTTAIPGLFRDQFTHIRREGERLVWQDRLTVAIGSARSPTMAAIVEE